MKSRRRTVRSLPRDYADDSLYDEITAGICDQRNAA